jgi:hypothetical protein
LDVLEGTELGVSEYLLVVITSIGIDSVGVHLVLGSHVKSLLGLLVQDTSRVSIDVPNL